MTGNYKLITHPGHTEHHDVKGGEELEMIAVPRKPIRELSCNSNIRTNLEPEVDREVLRGMYASSSKKISTIRENSTGS